jgi:hypothetical protein
MNQPEPVDPKTFAAGMNALRMRLAERVLPRVADPAERSKIAALVAKLEELQVTFPEMYEREIAHMRERANQALSAAQALRDEAKQRLEQSKLSAAEAPATRRPKPPPVQAVTLQPQPPLPAVLGRSWMPGDWPLSDDALTAAGERLVRRVLGAAPPPHPVTQTAGDVVDISSGSWSRPSSDSQTPLPHPAAAPPAPAPKPDAQKDVAGMESDDWDGDRSESD